MLKPSPLQKSVEKLQTGEPGGGGGGVGRVGERVPQMPELLRTWLFPCWSKKGVRMRR